MESRIFASLTIIFLMLCDFVSLGEILSKSGCMDIKR